jgi:sulfane dehydrogenase subunit SoxC
MDRNKDVSALDMPLPTAEAARARTGRRAFLAHGIGVVGTAAAGLVPSYGRAAQDATREVPRWMQTPGAPMRGYGQPSKFEEPVKRFVLRPYGAVAPGIGPSFTPLHALNGTITPSGLHFERHHNGVPDIDPGEHRLLIHGMVARALSFSMDALARYPMISRVCFIECAGNSGRNTAPRPPQVSCGEIHGLIGCSEWTGRSLALLLREAGIDPRGTWILAEGADAAAMSRSVPLDKALDDAIVALYQNGERLRPEQGYPVRLLLPGWEGNMSVKWLRRIKVTDGPTHTKDETSKYSELMPDGKARQFTFEMGVKSVITQPAAGLRMQGHGPYEISGIAWSGAGKIRSIAVSYDGGITWRDAILQEPVLSKSVTRFRLPWHWSGERVQLQSRAVDEKGNVQPTRASWLAQFAPGQRYHNNMIQTWAIETDGSIGNAYL